MYINFKDLKSNNFLEALDFEDSQDNKSFMDKYKSNKIIKIMGFINKKHQKQRNNYNNVQSFLRENLKTKEQWANFLNERNKVIELSENYKINEIMEINKFINLEDNFINSHCRKVIICAVKNFLEIKENKENSDLLMNKLILEKTDLEYRMEQNNYEKFSGFLFSKEIDFINEELFCNIDKDSIDLTGRSTFLRILDKENFILWCLVFFTSLSFIPPAHLAIKYNKEISNSFIMEFGLLIIIFLFFSIIYLYEMINSEIKKNYEQKSLINTLFKKDEDIYNFAVEYINFFSMSNFQRKQILKLCNDYIYEKENFHLGLKLLFMYVDLLDKKESNSWREIGLETLKDYEIKKDNKSFVMS